MVASNCSAPSRQFSMCTSRRPSGWLKRQSYCMSIGRNGDTWKSLPKRKRCFAGVPSLWLAGST
jgi:hypothetical protein